MTLTHRHRYSQSLRNGLYLIVGDDNDCGNPESDADAKVNVVYTLKQTG